MGISVKLRRLKTEDFIWIIYLFISIAAIISNVYERNYDLTNNLESQKKFKLINITIFIIAFFIYFYFVLINYEDIKHLKREATKKEVITSHLAFIASMLFLIGGIIYILVELNRDSPDEDISII